MRKCVLLGSTAALVLVVGFATDGKERAFAAVTQAVRSIFLNGEDISGARSQELKNVDVVINEKGDLFIVAPHYQVNEEDTYVPLSKYVQGMNGPRHEPMKKLPPPAGGETPMVSGQRAQPMEANALPQPASGPIPKAGTPVGQTGVAGAPAGEAPKAKPKADGGEDDEKKEKTED